MNQKYIVNGKEYAKSDEAVGEGDLIVITAADEIARSYYGVGDIGRIRLKHTDGDLSVNFSYLGNSRVVDDGGWYVGDDSGSNYAKLVPTGKCTSCSDCNHDDHIAGLAKTTADLRSEIRRLDDRINRTETDVVTFAEKVLTAEYMAGQALTTSEMANEDIAMLDERTQLLVGDTSELHVKNGEGSARLVETTDAINPSHYTQGDVEVIDYIDQVCASYSSGQAPYVANIVKYVSRAPHKNGLEDAKKALWYLERLIEQWTD